MATSQTNTVILGAGIIGVSTAYYLSQSPTTPPQSIHLVEVSPKLFASASGFAGGFVAKDWFERSTASLGALSFDLHKKLAYEHDGRNRWGYSRSTGTSMVDLGGIGDDGDAWMQQGGSRAEAAGHHEFKSDDVGPAWLTRRGREKIDIIGDEDSVAQVDPLKLCQFLLGESLERGVRLHHPAKAISVAKDATGELASIRITSDGEEFDIPCSRILITAGAWSPLVFSTLFPESKTRIPISSLAGHSLTLKSPRWTAEHEAKGCHAVFATDSAGYSPEIFSRIGGEIYIAGVNDSSLPLPKLATDSQPQEKELQKLKNTARRMLGLPAGEDDLQIIREGLCFRPVTSRGPPIVSRIPDASLGGGLKTPGGGDGGIFLSAGHGPWGISQSLGSGKVLSEMLQGKSPSANVKSLSL